LGNGRKGIEINDSAFPWRHWIEKGEKLENNNTLLKIKLIQIKNKNNLRNIFSLTISFKVWDLVFISKRPCVTRPYSSRVMRLKKTRRRHSICQFSKNRVTKETTFSKTLNSFSMPKTKQTSKVKFFWLNPLLCSIC